MTTGSYAEKRMGYEPFFASSVDCQVEEEHENGIILSRSYLNCATKPNWCNHHIAESLQHGYRVSEMPVNRNVCEDKN